MELGLWDGCGGAEGFECDDPDDDDDKWDGGTEDELHCDGRKFAQGGGFSNYGFSGGIFRKGGGVNHLFRLICDWLQKWDCVNCAE